MARPQTISMAELTEQKFKKRAGSADDQELIDYIRDELVIGGDAGYLPIGPGETFTSKKNYIKRMGERAGATLDFLSGKDKETNQTLIAFYKIGEQEPKPAARRGRRPSEETTEQAPETGSGRSRR
jgi:hypothetical protein